MKCFNERLRDALLDNLVVASSPPFGSGSLLPRHNEFRVLIKFTLNHISPLQPLFII